MFCGSLQFELHESGLDTVGLHPIKAACPRVDRFCGAPEPFPGAEFPGVWSEEHYFKVGTVIRDLDNRMAPKEQGS